MLPSKGYFRSFACPYHDLDRCDRPHCHFRHVKKALITVEAGQLTVPKVQVVEEPKGDSSTPNGLPKDGNLPKEADHSEPSYKPTPLSELRKRHIPVMHAPERPCLTRKIPRIDSKSYVLGRQALIESTISPSASCLGNGIDECGPSQSIPYIPNKINKLESLGTSCETNVSSEPINDAPSLELAHSLKDPIESLDEEKPLTDSELKSLEPANRSDKNSSRHSPHKHKKSSHCKRSRNSERSHRSNYRSPLGMSRKAHKSKSPERVHHSSHRRRSSSNCKSSSKEKKKQNEYVIELSSDESVSQFPSPHQDNQISESETEHEPISSSSSVDPSPRTKLRVSRAPQDGQARPPMKILPPDPVKAMCHRWLEVKDTVSKPVQAKVRISHVPNVSSILNAKNSLLTKATMKHPPKVSENLPLTVDLPVVKTTVRVAHRPKPENQSKPRVQPDDEIVIPLGVRQSCVNALYEELGKYLNSKDAAERALNEERDICKRIKTVKTYQNSVAMAVLKVRKTKGMEQQSLSIRLTPQSRPPFTYGLTIYECLTKYVLNEEQLIEHGFPREVDGKTGCAYVSGYLQQNRVRQPDDPSQRICENCGEMYTVNENGVPLEENNCLYHFKRAYANKASSFIARYACCGQERGSEPCTIGRYHLSDTSDPNCLEGFIKTKHSSPNQTTSVFAVDCEMVSTTMGVELGRVTVVDINGECVYDVIVKPDSMILDYRTRFSGLSPSSYEGVTSTLLQVQNHLLKLFTEETILVGHSLENDLKALKIIHSTVIDTSVMFPHRMGLPHKKSLKNLAAEYLKKIIQQNDSGHDSLEDAVTCIELIMWQVREDCKIRKPRTCLSST